VADDGVATLAVVAYAQISSGVSSMMTRPAGPTAIATEWDAGELGCGELLLALRDRLQALQPGQVLKLTALDPGARADIPAWCRLTGHVLVEERHPAYLIRRRES
jgi:tRNA 2-thiouridine synthesizing protein A